MCRHSGGVAAPRLVPFGALLSAALLSGTKRKCHKHGACCNPMGIHSIIKLCYFTCYNGAATGWCVPFCIYICERKYEVQQPCMFVFIYIEREDDMSIYI